MSTVIIKATSLYSFQADFRNIFLKSPLNCRTFVYATNLVSNNFFPFTWFPAIRTSQTFSPLIPPRKSGCADLISSYSVVPPLLSPGFHVNVGKPPPPPPTRSLRPRTTFPTSSKAETQLEMVSVFFLCGLGWPSNAI